MNPYKVGDYVKCYDTDISDRYRVWTIIVVRFEYVYLRSEQSEFFNHLVKVDFLWNHTELGGPLIVTTREMGITPGWGHQRNINKPVHYKTCELASDEDLQEHNKCVIKKIDLETVYKESNLKMGES